jgi:hypothetical protein
VNTLCRLAVVIIASVVLPAQALAQSATTPTAPAKAAVVAVQRSAPAPTDAQVVVQQTPAAPAKPQVVVQTNTAPAQVSVQTSSAPAPVVVQTSGAAAAATGSAALPKPTLTVDLPTNATLGETLSVQAALVGPDGAPIRGADIDVSTSATFLNTQSSVAVGHGVTDAQGSTSIAWEPRSTGNLTLTATFGGNSRLGAATANATLIVRGDAQLYQQQAGVVLPGLNAAPGSTAMASLAGPVASPWPRISGWPLVVVLTIVWLLYGRAVWGLFTIARGREPEAATGGTQ